MGFKALAWADEVRTGCNGRKSLLLRLAVNADDVTGVCWRATTTLSWALEMGGRSVRRHTADLVAMGLLVITPRYDRAGGRRANVFRLVYSEEERTQILAAQNLTLADVPAKFFKRLKLTEPDEGDDMGDPDDLFSYAEANGGAPRPSDLAPPPMANLARGSGLRSPGGPDSGVQGGRSPWPGGVATMATHENLSENQNPKSGEREARERAGQTFKELWEKWPEESRPREMGPVFGRFLKLDATDQELAAQHALTYRLRLAGLKEDYKVNVHDYITARAWRELDGAPPCDGDGLFKITPDRPEWASWRAYHERRGDPVATIDKQGIMLRRTRWHPGYDPRLSRATGGAA